MPLYLKKLRYLKEYHHSTSSSVHKIMVTPWYCDSSTIQVIGTLRRTLTLPCKLKTFHDLMKIVSNSLHHLCRLSREEWLFLLLHFFLPSGPQVSPLSTQTALTCIHLAASASVCVCIHTPLLPRHRLARKHTSHVFPKWSFCFLTAPQRREKVRGGESGREGGSHKQTLKVTALIPH